MRKLIFIYLAGTISPLILFLIEKSIPHELLRNITILSEDIKLLDYSGVLETIILIALGIFIIFLNSKNQRYLFNVFLNSRSIIILSSYSIYRIINSSFFFYKFSKYNRDQIQIIESITRDGFAGILVNLLNSIFPIVVTLVLSSYLSLEKNSNKILKHIIQINIINLGISSILFDLTRGSRGNITLFAVSLIIAYLITFRKFERISSFRNYSSKVILCFTIITILLGNTYYRSIKLPHNINTNAIVSYNNKNKLVKLFHDSTIAKAVGGQIVTNKGINGDLKLTKKLLNPYLFKIDIDPSFIQSRDSYCKKFDCLHIFKPLKTFLSFLGYSKEVNSIYISLNGNFPFNSSSHLGELYIVFNRRIAPIVYLLLIQINIYFLRSKHNNPQFISLVNLFYFSLFAFTSNWFLTFYPYINHIFSILFFNLIGIKIKKISKKI